MKPENEVLCRRIQELESSSSSRRRSGTGIAGSGSTSTNTSIAEVEDVEGAQKENNLEQQHADLRRKSLLANPNLWKDLERCRDVVGLHNWAADNGMEVWMFPQLLFSRMCHAGKPLPVLLDALEDVALGTPGNLNFLLDWQLRKRKGEGVLRKRLKVDDLILLQQWMRRQLHLGLKTEDDIFVFLRFVSRVSDATRDESLKCSLIASIVEGLQSSSVFGFKDLGRQTQFGLFKSIARGPVTRQSLDLGFSLIKAMRQSQSEDQDQKISAFIGGVVHAYASLREQQKRETPFLEVIPRALEMMGGLPQDLACSVMLITTKDLIESHFRMPAIKAATVLIPNTWWSALAKLEFLEFPRMNPLKIEIEIFLKSQKPELVVSYLQQSDDRNKTRFILRYWIGPETRKIPLKPEIELFLSSQKPEIVIPYLQQLNDRSRARFVLRYWIGPETQKIPLQPEIELFLSTQQPDIVISYLQQLDDQDKARFILRYWIESKTRKMPLENEIEIFLSNQKPEIVILYLQQLYDRNKARFMLQYWVKTKTPNIPLQPEIELFLSTQKPEIVVLYLQQLDDQDKAHFVLRYWVGPKTPSGQSRARYLFDEFCSTKEKDSPWVSMFQAARDCALESTKTSGADVKQVFKVLQMLQKSESIVDIIKQAGKLHAFIDESDVVYTIREHLGTRPHLAERLFHFYPRLRLEKCPELAERLILTPGSHPDIALHYMQNRRTRFPVEREAFSQVRLQLLDRMASAYSKALHLTPRMAFRKVHTCYIQRIKERLGPPSVAMACALVRAGLIRPLQAGRWVGTTIVRWILSVIRSAQGPDVADQVDEVVYKWRRANMLKLRAALLANRRARYYATKGSMGFRGRTQ